MTTDYDAALDYDAVLDYDGIGAAPSSPVTDGGGGSGGARHAGGHFGTAGGYEDIRKQVEDIYAELANETTPVDIQERAAKVGMAFVDKPYSASPAIMPPAAALDFDAMLRNLMAIELLMLEYRRKMEWEEIAIILLSI